MLQFFDDYKIECNSSIGPAGIVWDAAPVLASYLQFKKHYIEGKSVVELGSGTGVMGLFLASMNPEYILLTDLPPSLPLIEKNINNATSLRGDKQLIGVEELQWGTKIKDNILSKRFDTILLSDCVYLESMFEPLIDTLKQLITPNNVAIMSYKKRRKADKLFFIKLKKTFLVNEMKDDPNYSLHFWNKRLFLYEIRYKSNKIQN